MNKKSIAKIFALLVITLPDFQRLWSSPGNVAPTNPPAPNPTPPTQPLHQPNSPNHNPRLRQTCSNPTTGREKWS